MPLSVRLDSPLLARLKKAAEQEHSSVSTIIRRAVDRYCEEAAGASLEARLADVLGIVASRGGRARDTGRAFSRLVRARHDAC